MENVTESYYVYQFQPNFPVWHPFVSSSETQTNRSFSLKPMNRYIEYKVKPFKIYDLELNCFFDVRQQIKIITG